MLRRSDLGLLLGAYVVLTMLWVSVGWWLKHADDFALVRLDRRLSQWWVDAREPRFDELSWLGSMLSDTLVKIVVTALLCGTMLWMWRRWLEPVVVAGSLILEAMVFITVTRIVGRPRPEVPRLEGSPVDSSFPSGHAAAATCYVAIAVVVFWHTRSRVWRGVAVVVTAFIPLAVGVSRMYRGMHYLTDIFAGFVLGAATVAITVLVATRAEARRLAAKADELDRSDARSVGADERGALAHEVVT